MAGHKKQHFVPVSYLKAWCDPFTPPGQEPFVWHFNKDGSNPRRKAPDNIFHETDLYTIRGADSERDLRLEHGLAGLESEFAAIRDTKLGKLRNITPREQAMLCAFIAAARARTPSARAHHVKQWSKVLEQMTHMREWAKIASSEEKRDASSVARGSGPSLGYDDVKEFVERPMEMTLVPAIEAGTPLLMELDFCVLNAGGESAFITSDYPCVWSDPEGYTRPPFYQRPALMYESIEITLPVSPQQLILLNRRGRSGFHVAGARAVDEINRRTRFDCSECFVSHAKRTKPIWFDPGVEPENSWRKQNAADDPSPSE